jgi:hypothetical protein
MAPEAFSARRGHLRGFQSLQREAGSASPAVYGASLQRWARERFRQEIAFYRADAPFLPVEKCAARCAQLSTLLAVASLHSTVARAGLLTYTR